MKDEGDTTVYSIVEHICDQRCKNLGLVKKAPTLFNQKKYKNRQKIPLSIFKRKPSQFEKVFSLLEK